MTPLVLAILNMISVAEPAIVQLVHDLLAKAGGKSDQDILTGDVVDLDAIIAEARKQLGQ